MSLPAAAKEMLAARLGDRVRFDEPMSRWTYFQVGGPADALVVPQDEEDLRTVLEIVNREKGAVPMTVIGLGTNLVVRDGGIRGVVVAMTRGFSGIEIDDRGDEVLLHLGASVPVCDVTALCIDRGLSGFEFASGIPGNIGGAVFMNAGTREGEMKDILVSIRVLDRDGRVREVSRADLEMTYRRTRIEPDWIILAATLRLRHGDPAAIQKRCEELVAWRQEKQPGDLPCAGSIFKNPGDVPAARLIHQAGLQGMRIGGAVVSPKHTNFIVNEGGATAAQILALIDLVRQRVQEHAGVRLETEVKILGEDLV